MKINIQTKGVLITSKQKAQVEKKITRMKRYVKEEPLTVDVMFIDETSPQKGGIDQAVHINATFGKEKIFIEEVDDRLMRAFALALKRFERQLTRFHRKKVEKLHKVGEGRLEKIIGFVKRKKKK